MTRALALSAAVIAIAAQARADCALPEHRMQLLAPAAVVPAGGAIVVGTYDDCSSGGAVPPPPAVVTAAGQRVPLRVETIGAGLYRWVPVSVLPPGAHRAEGVTGPSAVTIGGAVPPLARPSPTALSRAEELTRRGTRITVAARLGAAPPATAIAVVARSGGQVVTWRRIDGQRTTTLVVHESGGTCGRMPQGMVAPAAGTRLELAWIDAGGSLSGWSPPLAVR
jgi:hypothetical protein